MVSQVERESKKFVGTIVRSVRRNAWARCRRKRKREPNEDRTKKRERGGCGRHSFEKRENTQKRKLRKIFTRIA